MVQTPGGPPPGRLPERGDAGGRRLAARARCLPVGNRGGFRCRAGCTAGRMRPGFPPPAPVALAEKGQAPAEPRVSFGGPPAARTALGNSGNMDTPESGYPHDRTHRGQFFLVLRRHAGHFDRAAAVPDTPPGPALRGSRPPASGADGSRGGYTPPQAAVRDACRDLAVGPWRTAPPAGDPPGLPRPIVVSGARPLASGGHSLVAGGCSCAATDSSRAAVSRRRAPAASTLPEPIRGRCAVPQSGATSGRRSSRHWYATIGCAWMSAFRFLHEMVECEQAAPAVLRIQPNRAPEPGGTKS